MEYQKLETECWERATNVSHGWKRLSMHEVDLKLKNGCGNFVFGSKMSACTRFDGLGWGQLEPEDWAGWHTLREENEGVVIKKKKLILLSMICQDCQKREFWESMVWRDSAKYERNSWALTWPWSWGNGSAKSRQSEWRKAGVKWDPFLIPRAVM